jgi:lipopolysaccharide export LptBFGC system permease protein LptF
MRACGISLYRAALPLLIFAVAWSGLLFLLEDRVLGEANRTAAELRRVIRNAPPMTVRVANHHWLVGDGDRILHYAFLEPGTTSGRPTLHRLSVFETAVSPYRLTSHTYADRARLNDETWVGEDGWTQAIDLTAATRTEFSRQPIALAPIDDFRRAQVDSRSMSFREMRAYLQRLGASGYNVTEQFVDLHRKLAFPAVTVVMTLLAIPFGVTVGRRGTLYGIGLAMVLAVGYLLLMSFFMAVGAAGLLPPALAAWGANLIFAGGAAFLLFSVRT